MTNEQKAQALQPMNEDAKATLTERLTNLIERANSSLNHVQIFTAYKDALPNLPQEAVIPLVDAIDLYEAELNALLKPTD